MVKEEIKNATSHGLLFFGDWSDLLRILGGFKLYFDVTGGENSPFFIWNFFEVYY